MNWTELIWTTVFIFFFFILLLLVVASGTWSEAPHPATCHPPVPTMPPPHPLTHPPPTTPPPLLATLPRHPPIPPPLHPTLQLLQPTLLSPRSTRPLHHRTHLMWNTHPLRPPTRHRVLSIAQAGTWMWTMTPTRTWTRSRTSSLAIVSTCRSWAEVTVSLWTNCRQVWLGLVRSGRVTALHVWCMTLDLPLAVCTKGTYYIIISYHKYQYD